MSTSAHLLILTLAITNVAVIEAQTSSRLTPYNAPQTSGRDLSAQQHEQDLRIQFLEKRIDEQQKDIDQRFEEIKERTTWTFGLLAGFGTLGGLFAFASWSKGREDYLSERQFYEKRISASDSQQKESMAQHSKQNDRIVDAQIESIAKLKDVIELVRQSFEHQVESTKNATLVTELMVDLDKYASVRDRILPFQNISRMDWPNLGIFQFRLAEGARDDFRAIPACLLRQDEKREPYDVARVRQILGASAYYANDIEYAERLLKRAIADYESQSMRTDHQDSMGASYYFMGLICKNWIDENRPLEDCIADAKRYLTKAQDILKDKIHEFLIPVTLAEVMSYLESDRSQARAELVRIISQIRQLPEPDRNQRRLLVRALILEGNVETNMADKAACYQQALAEEEGNAYAWLSLALITEDMEERRQRFERGLNAVKEAHLLDKREITTLASVIAWGVIASKELGGDSERARRDLEELGQSAISTGGRIPVIFCPINKTLCKFEKIRETVHKYSPARSRPAVSI